MNIGDVITTEPTVRGVIVQDRQGDYWAWGRDEGARRDGWDCSSSAATARQHASRAASLPGASRTWPDVTAYSPITVYEMGGRANPPGYTAESSPVKPADITALDAYKKLVRDKVIAEADAQGWCDRVDGWLKELGLEPRLIALPTGVGGSVRLKDDQGVAIRVFPYGDRRRYQWVRVAGNGVTSTATTDWTQENAESVNSIRSMS